MRRKERNVINFLLSFNDGEGEIEITASGIVMFCEFDITSYEAAKILRKIADEVKRDPRYNVNIYRINMERLREYEGSSVRARKQV